MVFRVAYELAVRAGQGNLYEITLEGVDQLHLGADATEHCVNVAVGRDQRGGISGCYPCAATRVPCRALSCHCELQDTRVRTLVLPSRVHRPCTSTCAGQE